MKFRNLFFAAILVFGFSACRDTANEDHGHEHGEGVEAHAHEEEEHGHPHDEDGGHMQEEFTVGEDSLDMSHEEEESHMHDDGTEHHEH
ncbi:hypothetical protein JRG66_02985 [Salinimicrobium tongyeongense]|jgi:hypothetical protein|uniref:Uncharacterized protein n=1 Tax=Salinimicrobium tongyeongense TaxID=2809707 RepID=A0ABY6NSH8_9FLAO|nr:hypothetical protein JRG66_02985 [Salinimicrobium tongyeongense]